MIIKCSKPFEWYFFKKVCPFQKHEVIFHVKELGNPFRDHYFDLQILQLPVNKLALYPFWGLNHIPTYSFSFRKTITAWKVSKYGVFPGPYFPTFGLNTERYGVYFLRTLLFYTDTFHPVHTTLDNLNFLL